MTGFWIRQLHCFEIWLYLINKKNRLKRLANAGEWYIINPIRGCRSSCKQKYNHESTEW